MNLNPAFGKLMRSKSKQTHWQPCSNNNINQKCIATHQNILFVRSPTASQLAMFSEWTDNENVCIIVPVTHKLIQRFQFPTNSVAPHINGNLRWVRASTSKSYHILRMKLGHDMLFVNCELCNRQYESFEISLHRANKRSRRIFVHDP